jgi:hypothetical protein
MVISCLEVHVVLRSCWWWMVLMVADPNVTAMQGVLLARDGLAANSNFYAVIG